MGKHLKVSRIDISIPNTVFVDVAGLSEPMRVIGIHWPSGQRRDLDDLLPYVIEGSVITGDFNTTVEEWNSPRTDKRGARVKEWMEENNFSYLPSTAHTSKRSERNIDLSLSNSLVISTETLHVRTSDHWPTVLTCENVSFGMSNIFPHTNWKAFEAILVILQ